MSALARTDPPASLRAWAQVIGSPEGPLPLLGTGRRAGAYAALQWNGALLRQVDAPVADGLTLVALAAAPPGATEGDLDRALATGLAVAAATDGAGGASPPTRLVLAAAACAAAVRDADRAVLDELPELAAALMAVTAPATAGDLELDLAAGHWLAAGWLAPVLQSAGLTGAPGTYADTVSALGGSVRTPVTVTVAPPGEPGRPVAQLWAELA